MNHISGRTTPADLGQPGRRLAVRAGRAATLGLLVLAAAAIVAGPVAASTRPGTASAAAASALEPRQRVTACADQWAAARRNPGVETYKAAGLCEVDRRLRTVASLNVVVDRARQLTDDHQAALEAILDRSERGLKDLRSEIAADTTIPDLRADIARIYEDFRIYVLVARQVHLVIATDVTEAAIDRAEQIANRLEQAIETAEAGGADVARATELLASMRTHLDNAAAAIDGIPETILPLLPADWNAGTAKPILDEARADLANARRVEFRSAIQDARAIVAELR